MKNKGDINPKDKSFIDVLDKLKKVLSSEDDPNLMITDSDFKNIEDLLEHIKKQKGDGKK
jgi:hypothetical protein